MAIISVAFLLFLFWMAYWMDKDDEKKRLRREQQYKDYDTHTKETLTR